MPVVSVEVIDPKTLVYTNDDGSTYTAIGGSRAWRNNNPGNLIYSSKEIGKNGVFI